VRRRTSRAARAAPLAAALLLGASSTLAPSPGRAENVALTFDDLPHNGPLAPNMTAAGVVRDVLEILHRRRAPKVYGFVNAALLEGAPDGAEALKLWVAGGERVGNHTYSHSDLNREAADSFIQDLRRDEPVLELLDRAGDWRWFRYPFLREGETLEKRRAVRAQLRERGYRIAQVTLDFGDYLWNDVYARCVSRGETHAIVRLKATYLATASEYLDVHRQTAKLVFGREISHVLVLHLGAFSSTILPDMLTLLKDKGFILVTLDEAERDPAYDADPDAASQNGGTLLEQWVDARGLARPTMPARPDKEMDAMCR
jgi:peptidoglycan/xylan/chitin deacetylase (PgdA/CDA1 family)